jgi:excisionase family DNA binding protein
MPDPLLLTQPQAAEALGVGLHFVRGLIARGEVGTVAIGADGRIPTAELRRWVEANTTCPSGAGGAAGRGSSTSASTCCTRCVDARAG